MLSDIHATIKLFRNKEIDDVAARVLIGLFRDAGKVCALQLEHARLTGRLGKGSSILPGFKFK